MATQVLTATQNVLATIDPASIVDKKGNPAKIDGAPVWTSGDESVVTVTAAEDGLSATISAVGPLTAPDATVQVVATADADLGEGLKPLVGTLDIQVIAGEAVAISISSGVPEEQA